jgi:hypothetical protein
VNKARSRSRRALPKRESCDANYVREVISKTFSPSQWLVLDQFPLEAGMRSRGTPRIDILAIKIGNGGGYGMPLTREAFEIKVNRRDFLSEIKNPEKRQRAFAVCDCYWFAVPEELVTEDEIPSECGLMWVSRHSAVPTIMRMPATLNTDQPSPLFMMDVARRAYQIGRRHGSETCALERFDLVCNLAHLLIKNTATAVEREQAVRSLSSALVAMQRHVEAKELTRIAVGGEPSDFWSVPRTVQSWLRVGL